MQRRIDDILQQRVRMGEGVYAGCGEYGCGKDFTPAELREIKESKRNNPSWWDNAALSTNPKQIGRGQDYSDLMGEGGVYAGRAKRRATKRKAPKRNQGNYLTPWIEFVKDFALQFAIPYRQALSEAGPSYHAMKGSGGGVYAGAARKKKRGSKVAKKKAPGKRARYPRTTLAAKLAMTGLTKAQWNKLTAYQKNKIGKFYKERSKNKVCNVPEFKGKYFLARPKKCIIRTKGRKAVLKRGRLANLKKRKVVKKKRVAKKKRVVKKKR